jgi:hypothetical protein
MLIARYGEFILGDVIGAIVEMLSVYLLYALGRCVIAVLTLGRYKPAPYKIDQDKVEPHKQQEDNLALDHLSKATIVSKKDTMILDFIG